MDIANSTRRRVMLRLMPFLFVLYIIAFIDRVNVGFAVLGMQGDLGFSDHVIGTGAGIFFIGYFLLEMPGTILVERWSARKWIARIMVSWGIVAILMGFIHSQTQFYLARFVLGAAEAGFFPGIIVYFSHWFRYEDRAKAVALFMAAIPIANIFGSPISGLLLGANWFGIAGWRWLFIIEGVPAILFGFLTLVYLTDRPHQAKWLSEEQREWLSAELAREKSVKQVHSISVFRALVHREVLLLTAAYFFMVTAVYGFNFWLPTILKRISGSSNLVVTLISALPYCAALVAMLLVGWSSDRTGERRWHTALAMTTAGIGLLLSMFGRDSTGIAVAMFCVAAAGMYSYLPGFWALPSSFLVGTTAAAASIGMINSIGNLGGFAGPFVVGYLSDRTGSFLPGVLYLAASAILAAFLVLSLRATKRERSASPIVKPVASG